MFTHFGIKARLTKRGDMSSYFLLVSYSVSVAHVMIRRMSEFKISLGFEGNIKYHAIC